MIRTTFEATSGPMPSPGISVIRCIVCKDNTVFDKHSAEVVIVGGGVIGLTIARSLALRGVRDVCLIERAILGTEASFAAAGMLLPQVEAATKDDLFTLACRSRDAYTSFAAALYNETGIDVELDTTGTLYLALTEHDQEEIEKGYYFQHRAGLSIELLDAMEARELEPCISSS